jgi:hypothetical protein
MPSLIGTYIAANYQTTVAPYSNFGTRKLSFIKVVLGGGGASTAQTPDLTSSIDPVTGQSDSYYAPGSGNNTAAGTSPTSNFYGNAWEAPNSALSILVRTVQQWGELYYVSYPVTSGSLTSTGTSSVILGVAYDTFNDANASSNTEIITTTGTAGQIDVTNPGLSGSNVFVALANQLKTALSASATGYTGTSSTWSVSGTVTISEVFIAPGVTL